jgi:lactose/L-arabinose transport system permease protein
MKQRERIQSILLHLTLTPLALLFLVPIFWMLIAATQPNSEIISSPPAMYPGEALSENWEDLNGRFVSNNNTLGYIRIMINSIVIAVIYTIVATLISAMAGYAFAKFNFRGKKILFSIIILTMTIPYSVVVIPQFLLVARELGLTNTYWAVILPALANTLGVFFMRQSLLGLPDELLDAARVDGANELRIFFQIVLPMSLPSMAAIGIVLFLAQWNDYLWPLLVLTDPSSYTIPVALGTLVGLTNISWGGIMIGTSLATIPFLIMFLFLQRYFIAGIAAGAVKE